MSSNYFSESNNYPSIILPIIERIRYYICKETFYSGEEYNTSKNLRFSLAEVTDNAFRVASKVANSTNFNLPITIYGIGELEEDEKRLNPNAFLGMHYSSAFSGMISSMATIFNLPMITLFNTASDYMRSWTILQKDRLKKNILSVPAVINGITDSFPVLIEFDPPPLKGMLAFELEQQLNKGKINTIQHDMKIYFHNLVVDAEISPIDDIELFMESYSEDDYRDSISVGSGLVPDTPEILSTTPEDEKTDIAIDSTIIIKFNVAMNEDSVNDNIYIDPYTWFETTWNINSTQVTITPNSNLSNNTEYSITIYEEAESGDEITMEEDYTFSFTTVE